MNRYWRRAEPMAAGHDSFAFLGFSFWRPKEEEDLLSIVYEDLLYWLLIAEDSG
jgi:hypothetical protein